MKEIEIVGFLITIVASLIVVILSEILKIDILIFGIIASAIFIIILIISLAYYLKQINERIGKNEEEVHLIKKDLNMNNRLINVEKDIEWLKKKK